RPGITGPAATAFVDEEEILATQTDKEKFYLTTILPRKLQLDLNYCVNISLKADLQSILVTFARIFSSSRARNLNREAAKSDALPVPKTFLRETPSSVKQ